jgi:Tfp pilus assembly protein PilN
MFDVNLVAPAGARRGRAFLSAAAVPAALLVLVGFGVWIHVLDAHVDRLRNELSRTTDEIASLRPAGRHAQDLEQYAQEMHRRLDLLHQLLKTKTPASRILFALHSTVPQSMSITGVTVGANDVIFEGYATSYPSIARFMVELANSRLVRHVALTSSQRASMFGVDVVKFEVAGEPAGGPSAISQGRLRP